MRDRDFDIIKGILILLVVVGHAIADSYYKIGGVTYNKVYNAIYLFHMPLFIFVSGYFVNSITRYSFYDVVKKKVNRLILPWLIWSSVAMVILGSSSDFYNMINNTKCTAFVELVKFFFRTYTQYLWFLPCLFILTCVYYPILRIQNSTDKKAFVLISIVILLLWLMTIVFSHKLPFQYLEYLQITKQMLPFGMGLIYFFIKDKLKVVHYILLMTFAIIGTIVGFYSYGIWQCNLSMTEKIYSNIMLVILMFCVLKFCCNFFIKIPVLGSALCWCGQNSLGIYVIHMFWRTIFRRFDLITPSIDYLSIGYLTLIYIILSVVVILCCRNIFKQKSYILGI